MKSVDNLNLSRWRSLDARAALCALADHVREDRTYRPIGAAGTERLYVSAAGHDWELLVNGPKFFDTRAGHGGGGAVDLAMHLFGLPFKGAVSLLRERGL
jgi:hypothetical protein